MITIGSARAVADLAGGLASPVSPSTVTYELETTGEGTRLTLRHAGIMARPTCAATCIGWETSFGELARILS